MSRIFILTGASGAGKSTVLAHLLRRKSLGLTRFVTTTTRPPRTGERHGRDYWFVPRATFEQEHKRGRFYEAADVYGQWYGSNRREMERLQKTGRPIILILDVQGAATIKREHPEAVVIFLDSPKRDLISRLKRRRASPDELARRIRTMDRELAFRRQADVVVPNRHGQLSETVAQVAREIQNRLTV